MRSFSKRLTRRIVIALMLTLDLVIDVAYTRRRGFLGVGKVWPCQLPASQHGEVIHRLCAVLLDSHCHADHHPARRLFKWDADWLVWVDTGETAHVGNIRFRIVLVRRSPSRDNAPDGVEAVLMIIGNIIFNYQLSKCQVSGVITL